MPTCVLARSPQAFAIPVDGHDLKDLKKYLQPLQQLGSIAAELTKLTYGTGCQIQAVAIVEEQEKWWLVLGLTRPTKRMNLIDWLRTRVQGLDLERMETVTVWHQRRFGWGDVRTTPEILAALQQEARLRPNTLRELGKHQARRELAKAELRLRQPRATANPDHPILATYMGELALRARKQEDASLLNELQQASTSFPALPGPPPLLALDNGALAVG